MKRIITLLLITLIALTALTACTAEKPSDTPDKEGTVFSPNIRLTIVRADFEDGGFAAEMQINISKLTGKQPTLVNAGAVAAENELVIGDSPRPVSIKAREKLDSILNETYDAGWVIYSEGGSIAIVYSGPEARELAFEHFRANYLSSDTLVFEETHCNSKYFILREYYKQLEDADISERWDKLEAEYGSELISPLRKHYELYGDEMLVWLAGLYDKDVGGFYNSESAKLTTGFLPDIKSTADTLSIISDSGMAGKYSKKLQRVLPEDIALAIGNFVYARQTSGGSFYNIRWSSTVPGERRAIDTAAGFKALSLLSRKPRYKYGSGEVLPYYVITPVKNGGVAAVDSLLEDLEELLLPEHLKSEDAFRAYLDTLDPITNYKTAPGVLNAEWATVQLAGLDGFCLDYITERQNAANGLFENEGNYGSIRRFIELTEFLTSHGRVPEYIGEAAETISKIGIDSADTESVVDTAVPWLALSLLLDATEPADGEEESEDRAALRECIGMFAPMLIEKTTVHLANYKKADGSFSYYKNENLAIAYTVQVAVPGNNEGDIPSTYIATAYITRLMYYVIGVTDFIEIYTATDLEEIVDILAGSVSVEKKNDEKGLITFDFEDQTVGEEPENMLVYQLSPEPGHINVVEDNGGKALEIKSLVGQGYGDSVIFNMSLGASGGGITFEGDFCVVESNDKYVVQITVGDAYFFCFTVKDGLVYLHDASHNSNPEFTTEFERTVPVGEWFGLRIDHYTEGERTKTLVYVNGELIGVSSVYYRQSEKNPTAPNANYVRTRVYLLHQSETVLRMDNIKSHRIEIPTGLFDEENGGETTSPDSGENKAPDANGGREDGNPSIDPDGWTESESTPTPLPVD